MLISVEVIIEIVVGVNDFIKVIYVEIFYFLN